MNVVHYETLEEIANYPGLMKIDIHDLNILWEKPGFAFSATGFSSESDPERSITAYRKAIEHFPFKISCAHGLLVSLAGTTDVTYDELDILSTFIYNQVSPHCNIIINCTTDPKASNFHVYVGLFGLPYHVLQTIQHPTEELERHIKSKRLGSLFVG